MIFDWTIMLQMRHYNNDKLRFLAATRATECSTDFNH